MKAISGLSMIIASAALSVLWLDSCCKHKITIQEEAIDLGVSTRGTKAIVDNKDSLISYCFADVANGGEVKGFGVYGYKKINNPSYSLTRLFDNVEVKPQNRSTDTPWSYTPIKYWDSNPNASYQFIAYWPHLGTESNNGAYVTEDQEVLTIHDIPCWQDGSLPGSADFMTDIKLGNYYGGDFSQDGPAKVKFTFSHILTKLVIRAYYVGIQENPVTVTGMSLKGTNILNTSGTVNCTQNFSSNGSISWAAIPYTSNPHTLFDGSCELDTCTWDDEDEDSLDHKYQVITEWLTVPCTGWENFGLDIDFSIGGSTPISAELEGLTFSTVVNNVKQRGQTNSGKTYMITLRFDSSGGGVDLYSVLVKDWETEEINTSVYNW